MNPNWVVKNTRYTQDLKGKRSESEIKSDKYFGNKTCSFFDILEFLFNFNIQIIIPTRHFLGKLSSEELQL